MSGCSIPNCDYYRRITLRKKGCPDIPIDRVFSVKRPEFAKCPEEREHRQNLTNVILSLRDASKVTDRIKHMLHTERAGICERHFLKDDIEPMGKNGRMRLKRGAIPVLNVPRITYQMKMRLKQSQRRSKPRQHIQIQRIEATSKSIKTQTQDGLALPHENQECDEFENQFEETNQITLPTNDFSETSDLLYSLKDRMWRFIVKLQNFCTSMYKVLSQQYTDRCNFSRQFESTNMEAEILKELFNQDHYYTILHQQINQEDTCSDQNKEKLDIMDERDEAEVSHAATLLHINMITIDDNSEAVESLQSAPASTSLLGNLHTTMPIIDIPEAQKCKVKRKKTQKSSRTSNKKLNTNKQPVEGKIVKIDLTTADIGTKEKTLTEQNENSISRNTTTTIRNIKNKVPFRTAAYFKKLKVEHDERGTVYKCVICDELFKTWFLLRHHDKTQHAETWKRNKKRSKCQVCGKMVVQIKTHMLKHTKIRNFTCEICGAKFMQQANLTTHRHKIACILPSFECNVCNERFITEEEYANHFKEKHMKKNIICDLCGDEVCEKCVEDKHQVTLLKLYKCKFCEESFTFKKEYCGHIKEKHEHDIKSSGWSKCPICSKFFKNNNSFRLHLDAHSPKQFLCECCPKTFKTLVTLKDHFSRKHIASDIE